VFHKYVFNLFNVEKDHSLLEVVTERVAKICRSLKVEIHSGKPKNIFEIAFSLNAGRIPSMYLIDPSGILHSYFKIY